jgi:hypothetical protein
MRQSSESERAVPALCVWLAMLAGLLRHEQAQIHVIFASNQITGGRRPVVLAVDVDSELHLPKSNAVFVVFPGRIQSLEAVISDEKLAFAVAAREEFFKRWSWVDLSN